MRNLQRTQRIIAQQRTNKENGNVPIVNTFSGGGSMQNGFFSFSNKLSCTYIACCCVWYRK